jgi:hypothetical protein
MGYRCTNHADLVLLLNKLILNDQLDSVLERIENYSGVFATLDGHASRLYLPGQPV